MQVTAQPNVDPATPRADQQSISLDCALIKAGHADMRDQLEVGGGAIHITRTAAPPALHAVVASPTRSSGQPYTQWWPVLQGVPPAPHAALASPTRSTGQPHTQHWPAPHAALVSHTRSGCHPLGF